MLALTPPEVLFASLCSIILLFCIDYGVSCESVEGESSLHSSTTFFITLPIPRLGRYVINWGLVILFFGCFLLVGEKTLSEYGF